MALFVEEAVPLVIAMLGVRRPKWCMGMDQFRKCCLAKFVRLLVHLFLDVVLRSGFLVSSRVFVSSSRTCFCGTFASLENLAVWLASSLAYNDSCACLFSLVCLFCLFGWLVCWLVG